MCMRYRTVLGDGRISMVPIRFLRGMVGIDVVQSSPLYLDVDALSYSRLFLYIAQ